MRNLLYSKIAAWFALVLIIAVIIVTFNIRPAWWAFIDEFFAFMAVFSQLVAVYIMNYNRYAAKKLQLFAAIFGILMIVSLIVEFIVYQFIYS